MNATTRSAGIVEKQSLVWYTLAHFDIDINARKNTIPSRSNASAVVNDATNVKDDTITNVETMLYPSINIWNFNARVSLVVGDEYELDMVMTDWTRRNITAARIRMSVVVWSLSDN